MLELLAQTGSTHGASMEASIRASVIASAGLPPEEAQGIGVYMIAFLIVLLVTGGIACARELRREPADRNLPHAKDH
jgi:hypothetical protein